jgi:putative transcriptional regulator
MNEPTGGPMGERGKGRAGEPDGGSLAGRLLVATALIDEVTFRRSVVLILEQNADGAMGLVLNQPLDADVKAVLPAWQTHVTAPGRLFRGGPVGIDTALGVVAVPGDGPEPDGVRRLFASIGLVDLDTAPQTVMGGLAGLRIYAGYAGWSAGQLESELAEGAWYVVSAEARDPFTDRPEALWRAVLRRQRGELAFMATYPDDPSAN